VDNKLTSDDDDLLAALGVDVEADAGGRRSTGVERLIAGFREIESFVDRNGRPPSREPGHDIFERMYAVRLASLLRQDDCRVVLKPFDRLGLLSGATATIDPGTLDDDDLLAELGVDADAIAPDEDITALRHVRPAADKKAAAEEVANRRKCEDFETFRPLFEQVQAEIDAGIRSTRIFEGNPEIAEGRYFVLFGQKAYVATVGEPFKNDHGYTDARLRVIFDNGTESNYLMRSLQRALQKDELGRRITEPSAGPLFADESEPEDLESGTVYVLRSQSDHVMVTANREILHKIGVTGGSVERRVANAKLDPTFLLADVEVVATYRLFNINRTKLENIIHRVFGPARLDITIKDRFDNPVVPREWFLVPLQAIDEAIDRIKDGTIGEYVYEPAQARLVEK